MNKKTIILTIFMAMGTSVGFSIKAIADLKHGWINTNSEWNYYENGNIKTGWINVNNTWYYMNELGEMKTGWQKINEVWYFMQDSGAMKTGWLKENGVWYYLNENGAMVSNTTIDGYYLGVDGAWIENISGNDITENEVNLQAVTMKTEKSTYELDTPEVKVYITNNSKKEIYYGLQYEIEKLENNKWVKVPFKDEPMFIEIAYILESGKTNSQVISLCNLEKLTSGKYRIIKSDGAWTAEFELK